MPLSAVFHEGLVSISTLSLSFELSIANNPRIRRSREDAQRILPVSLDLQRAAPWAIPALGTLREIMLIDKDMWVIREEERVAFETYPLASTLEHWEENLVMTSHKSFLFLFLPRTSPSL